MSSLIRLKSALKPAAVHLVCSSVVAIFAAALVFGFWYPYPYRIMSGGRELFLLIIGVDIVCGPLLTLVVFNPAKKYKELWRDISFIALVQLSALGYGTWTLWQARPLFLVSEVERFMVVAAPDLRLSSDLDAVEALSRLPTALQPSLFSGPILVALRAPVNDAEATKVMISYTMGGRDFAERPEFYTAYDARAALKTLVKAKPLAEFLLQNASQQQEAQRLAAEKGVDIKQWQYLPVLARQKWVAILSNQGHLQGFLKADGI